MYKPVLHILFLAIILTSFNVFAQVLPSDTVPAKITYLLKEDQVVLHAELRSLRGISGAPAPFYTYFWELGDGTFSFAKEPIHQYADTGLYHPRLYATNNYDDGKPPPTRPGSIKIKSKPNTRALAMETNFFKTDENLALKTNRMPKPDEEMVLILGYKKSMLSSSMTQNGTLFLFYNDKQFQKNNFLVADVRSHHQEKKTNLAQYLQFVANYQHTTYYAHSGPFHNPNLAAIKASTLPIIKEKLNLFKDAEAWQYNDLGKDEERFLFISIKTTPEMVKDTNAVVTLSALMIPDDPLADVSVYDLELQIVASHDPNKMILRNRSMSYRFLGKNRTLNYKVKFQNTGKGPAKLVNVGVSIPDNLDKSSLKILKTEPVVLNCDSVYSGKSCLDTIIKKDSINFIFRNIYLPGLQQEGINDADSTKGFIEYSIKFIKKPKKKPFVSGAAIIFDKNEPIYTNKSRAKFKPGISPGVITGYGFLGAKSTVNDLGKESFSLGFSLSPFSPYRKYLQAELFISSYSSTTGLTGSNPEKRDTVINRFSYIINQRDFYQESSQVNIDLVPLQLRYNVNSFIGFGAGSMLSLTLSKNIRNSQKLFLQQNQANGTINNLIVDEQLAAAKKTFSDVSTALFADVQLGLVRKGPALGFRFIQSLDNNSQRLFSYLSWKF